MRAIIQAGGKGARLQSITKDKIPKPMVKVLGKPLLQWQMQMLVENGIKEIFLVIGHLGQVIKDYFKDGEDFGVKITYIEEKEPMGTGGILFCFRDMFDTDEDILFLYGDIFWDISIERMQEYHHNKNANITAFAHPNSHPYDSDVLVLDNENRIVNILSKNSKRDFWYRNIVNAALYIIRASVINNLQNRGKVDFEKQILMEEIRKSGQVYAYCSTEYVKDAGTEERLHVISRDIESGYTSRRNLKYLQRCIFVDRDGTLNKWKGLISNPEELELLDGIAYAIRKINQSGYLVIAVTNQPVVARGICSIEELEEIHNKLSTLLGEEGAYLDDIVYCPHHPDKGYPEENPSYKIVCGCRKPQIGLILNMQEKYHIDLSESWMIGDTTTDIMTGKNAGTKTVLVLTGEAGCDEKFNVTADMTVSCLKEFVDYINKA